MKFATLSLLFALSPALAFAQEPKCPRGIGAEAEVSPKLVQPVPGAQLILCGWDEDNGPSGAGKHFVEFDVYSVSEKGEVSRSLKSASALNHYQVSGIERGLRFEEMIYQGEEWLPAFRSELTCQAGDCTFSKETCVFKAKKAGSTKDLKDLQSYLNGKKPRGPDDALVAQVAYLALSGDKKAQSMFLNGNPGLKLDGAPGEVFASYGSKLRRLKALHCLASKARAIRPAK